MQRSWLLQTPASINAPRELFQELSCLWSKNSTCLYCHWSEKVACDTSASSYLLPVEQLYQLVVQQLWSKKVQKYLDTLHLTPEVAHTSKGQLRHHQVASHLNNTGLLTPDGMEHVLQNQSSVYDIIDS